MFRTIGTDSGSGRRVGCRSF